jgi:hypothetical protein
MQDQQRYNCAPKQNVAMSARLIRRLAVLLLALYAFGQAKVVLAGCDMERASMAHAMAMQAGNTCGDCDVAEPEIVSAACVAHCTGDSQLPGRALAAIPPAPSAPLLPVVVPTFRSPPVVAYLPPGSLPRRILLHSFQV